MNGVLVVDKPAGPTSHDVVARVRRGLRLARVGHTGTLDPLATGVLPLVVGRATRLAQFLSGDEKEYLAGVRLGMATDTYDALGRPDSPAAAAVPGRDAVEQALAGFRGTYRQTPPPYSAKKVGGTPAYKLARSSAPVALEAVPVTVRDLTLLACSDGRAEIRVVCSSGFYVRTLAHALGQRLGCGAHLEALRRVRAGEFTLDEAVPLEAIERDPEAAVRHLRPMETLLGAFPRVVVNERGARRAAHGNALSPGDLAAPLAAAPDGPLRVVDAVGSLLGIARADAAGLLRPTIVLV
jgi:tRNA pseudouridine55 synthase